MRLLAESKIAWVVGLAFGVLAVVGARPNSTTGDEDLRAGLPTTWRIGDKTGTGVHGTTLANGSLHRLKPVGEKDTYH